jgi:hypothetical protein
VVAALFHLPPLKKAWSFDQAFFFVNPLGSPLFSEIEQFSHPAVVISVLPLFACGTGLTSWGRAVDGSGHVALDNGCGTGR